MSVEKSVIEVLEKLADPSVDHKAIWNNMLSVHRDERAILKNAFAEKSFPAGFKCPDMDLRSFNLTNCQFKDANLSHVQLNGSILDGASFDNCDMSRGQGPVASARKATFRNCKLANSDFLAQTNLNGSQIEGGDVSGTSFIQSHMFGVRFAPRYADENTKLTSLASALDMTIPKSILESLGPDRGGLSISQIQHMNVEHDLYTLQREFGGFWTLVHLAGMVLWLFPYTWFLIQRWFEAEFRDPSDDSITILHSFTRFIVTGGDGWREGWNWNFIACLTFGVGVIFNITRAMLLYKTKKLELEERITNLPVDFKLEGRWKSVYLTTQWLFWAFLLSATVSFLRFMLMRIPV